MFFDPLFDGFFDKASHQGKRMGAPTAVWLLDNDVRCPLCAPFPTLVGGRGLPRLIEEVAKKAECGPTGISSV